MLLLLILVLCALAAADILTAGQERFTTQRLHHDCILNRQTLQQRYFWYPPSNPKTSSMIFFYAGNEANVENYVKSCGLMHENAQEFNAAMVFAEHRFWGKSNPSDPSKHYEFAGPDQAIKDFVVLLHSLLKNETKSFAHGKKVRVIAFGGSYGGMLAAWMRLKHPNVIHAAVASSAPVLALPSDKEGFYKTQGSSYWNVVTKVYKQCSERIYSALLQLDKPHALSALGVCPPTKSNKRVPTKTDLLMWIGYALETLAMGDYHFPSDYITGAMLPARPASLACDRLIYAAARNKATPLEALREAIGVFYNTSHPQSCYHVPDRYNASFYDGLWDQYWCRWLIPQETYFAMQGPPNDMFLPLPLNWQRVAKHCKQETKVAKMDFTAVDRWFGAVSEQEWEAKASKIIWVNGGHDPWSAGGFYGKKNPTLPSIFIETGAHHVDLMFTKPNDPQDLQTARRSILSILKEWFSVSEEVATA